MRNSQEITTEECTILLGRSIRIANILENTVAIVYAIAVSMLLISFLSTLT